MGILQARILEWVVMPSSRGSSQPRDRTQVSPALQVDSWPSEPPGKPKITGVGSLSLFQGIFPTQESNRGLLHCGWILYQLSYQGSPKWALPVNKCNISAVNFNSHADFPLRLFSKIGYSIKLLLKVRTFSVGNTIRLFKSVKGISLMTIDAFWLSGNYRDFFGFTDFCVFSSSFYHYM